MCKWNINIGYVMRITWLNKCVNNLEIKHTIVMISFKIFYYGEFLVLLEIYGFLLQTNAFNVKWSMSIWWAKREGLGELNRGKGNYVPVKFLDTLHGSISTTYNQHNLYSITFYISVSISVSWKYLLINTTVHKNMYFISIVTIW